MSAARTRSKHARRRTRNAPAAVVLAAGQGTRMKSDKTKVLHEVGGTPMVCHAVRRALEVGASPVVVVVGHQAPLVQAVVAEAFEGDERVRFALQKKQRGTADAVRSAAAALEGFEGPVLITYGDIPLLSARTLRKLLRGCSAGEGPTRAGAALSLVTIELEEPTGYGRILRDSRGRAVAIVEEKDATREQRAIGTVNAGIYAVPGRFLFETLGRVRSTNRQRELYLTDLVALAVKDAVQVKTVSATAAEVSGVNDRAQLAAANSRFRAARNEALMKAGVTMEDPASTYVADSVQLARDVTLGPGVYLTGATRMASGVSVGPYSVIHDTVVQRDAVIRSHSVCDGAVVGPASIVGPFARLRPGARLQRGVHVGNFVEVKKSVLGRGSKANHLTYLGDATIGRKVNVGAGTITCNYDGVAKHQTVIEDGVFVGSDVQLVAPVTIGKNAIIAAGSPVTDDVPAGALAVARGRQVNIEGYVRRKRQGAGKRKR